MTTTRRPTPPWGDAVWRGTPGIVGGWDNLNRKYSPAGFFFAEDPGVAVKYSSRNVFGTPGSLDAYRIKPCRTVNLTDTLHHLVNKTKVHELLLDWMDGIHPRDPNPFWVHQQLEDGTLYQYDIGRSWNSLFRTLEHAGYEHVIVKDLSEINETPHEFRQEEPIIHVVFDRRFLEPVALTAEAHDWLEGLKQAA